MIPGWDETATDFSAYIEGQDGAEVWRGQQFYLARRLHFVDIDGNSATAPEVAVVFTPGWIFVQESSSDGYVLPRSRVLQVEGAGSR